MDDLGGRFGINCPSALSKNFEIARVKQGHLQIFKNHVGDLSIVRKGVLSPTFAYPPPPIFQNRAIPPDKQYLFFKNFAFYSSVDAVENFTVKEILISV